jgi:hypothetical protein
MVILDDEQIASIEQIVKAGTQKGRLQHELIDHACSSVEFLMENGMSFLDAKNEALSQLAPQGIAKLEKETIYFLTLTPTFIMKKFMYLSGFIAASGILTGFLFKLMHWPGAGAIMFLGFISLFVTMVLSLLNLNKNRKQISTSQITSSIIATVSGMFVAVGSIFKFLHYPGANILFIIGMILLVFIVVPSYFWQLYKKDIISN